MNAGGYIAGLGCRRGVASEDLAALLHQALRRLSLPAEALRGLASHRLKADEPGLLDLADAWGLTLTLFDSSELAQVEPRLARRSAVALAATGSANIAEACSLALADRLGAGPARLALPRLATPRATLALAQIQ